MSKQQSDQLSVKSSLFLSPYGDPRGVCKEILESERFKVSQDRPALRDVVEREIPREITTAARSDSASNLSGLSRGTWEHVLKEAQNFFHEIIKKHEHLLPQGFQKIKAVDPSVAYLSGSRLAEAAMASIRLDPTALHTEFTAICENIKKNVGEAINKLSPSSPSYEETKKKLVSTIDPRCERACKIRLSAILIHEMVHLVQTRLFIPVIPTTTREKAESRENDRSPLQGDKDEGMPDQQDLSLARMCISGNKVFVPRTNRWLGQAISEMPTVMSEIQYFRKNGFNLDPNYSIKINLQKELSTADNERKETAFSIIRKAGILSKDGSGVFLPLFRFKDKDGTEVGSGYSMTAQLFLDLAREIFRHDILSGKHPEAVLLERSLNSAANGKVNFFFRDAKFNGLDQLSPEEAASELRSYKKFLLRIQPMPSAVESVLFHAFIQAATFNSPENLIPLRRQIVNFMNSETEAKK